MESKAISIVLRPKPIPVDPKNDDTGLQIVHGDNGLVRVESEKNGKHLEVAFDHILEPSCAQKDVFDLVKDDIEDTLRGRNSTILAYGQTGSGKTFTMEGDINNVEKWGVVPRSIQTIFDMISASHEEFQRTQFSCKCSHIEIYNDRIFDLLDPTGRVRKTIKTNNESIFYVDNCVERVIANTDEALTVYAEGSQRRYKAETLANQHSSRSHSIFTIRIESRSQPDGESPIIRTSCLQLVDLAGSESLKDSDATDQRGTEGRMINRSLSSLSHLVSILSAQKQTSVESTPAKSNSTRHFFRDSILLQALQESLGGNCRTTFLVTINPDPACLSQTRSTLHFAQNVKKIKNTSKINKKDAVDNMTPSQLREALRNSQAQNLVFGQVLAGLQAQQDFAERQQAMSDEEQKMFFEIMAVNHQNELAKEREEKRQMTEELEKIKLQLQDVERARSHASKSSSVTASLFSSPIRYPSGPLLNSPVRTPTAGSRLNHVERELREAQETIQMLQSDSDALQQEKEKMKADYEAKLELVNADFKMVEELAESNMVQISELHEEIADKNNIIDSLRKKVAELEVRFATIKRDFAEEAKAAHREMESLRQQVADKDSKLEALKKQVKKETQKATQTKRRKERLEDEVATHDLVLDETHQQMESLVTENLELSEQVKELRQSINKSAKHTYQLQKLNDQLMASNLYLAALMQDRTELQDIPEEEVSIPKSVQGLTAADSQCDEDRFTVVWKNANTKPALIRRSILEVHYQHLIEDFDKKQRRASKSSKAPASTKENDTASQKDTPTKSGKSRKSLRHVTPLSPASAELLATNSLPAAPNVSVDGAIEATVTM